MKKIFLTIIALLTVSASLQAAPRTTEQIIEAAKRTLSTSLIPAKHKAAWKGELKVLCNEGPLIVMGYENGGYAIVTNDDLLPEVIGYSSTAYVEDCDNQNFLWWWNMARESAQQYINRGIAFVREAPDARYKTEVPQLMSTVWGQMEPYNNMCPLEYDANGNSRGRCVVGCVSTAVTQVMNYYQYPLQGTGTYTDLQTTDAFGNPRPITVDFADYTYDYTLMRDTYTPGNYDAQEADEVAKLSYTAGVAFDMIYGVDASGTYLESAASGLKNHLGYTNVKYYSRGYTGTSEWMNRIYNELSNDRPVVYGGADDIFTIGGGGHCFVFDGYDASGLVHVNWGWYGKFDGYYDVAILNPGIHSFHNQQDMIIGILPPVESEEWKEESIEGKTLMLSDFESLVEQSHEQGLRSVDLSACQLEDGVLPEFAFANSYLQRIVLPANIRAIGDGAFANCKHLQEVVFPENNGQQEFLVQDGIIYNADATELIEALPYYYNKEKVTDGYSSLLTVKDGVERIHQHAFDGCFRVKGVVLPASVTFVGRDAFCNASSIKMLKVKARVPADAAIDAFSRLDIGYTTLAIPAGTADVYSRSGEWAEFFRLDNVIETGTCIRARNAFRGAGQSNPSFSYQMLGEYVTGEPVLRCEADETSVAGEYPIIVEMGTLQGDEIYLENGVLTVYGEAGIGNIIADDNAATYNLQGMKSADGKIIIKNGKKIINIR